MDLSRLTALQEVDDKLNGCHLAAETWLKERKYQLVCNQHALHSVVAGFIETGVFVYGKRLFGMLDHDGIKLKGVLQRIAKQLDRPYIRAEAYPLNVYLGKNVKYDLIELIVPNTMRLRPIVAALLLAAQPLARGYRGMPSGETLATGHPLYLDEGKGSWAFFFVDGTGKELFDHFVKDCATDPIKRILLKL